ncbi:uncharacterized protein [Haliotis cracherodii]|uniref:uncharacterized protein n=1 Tax=Haliotis cracherodii TaxID=6455 RepID=UPI0039EC3DFA
MFANVASVYYQAHDELVKPKTPLPSLAVSQMDHSFPNPHPRVESEFWSTPLTSLPITEIPHSDPSPQPAYVPIVITADFVEIDLSDLDDTEHPQPSVESQQTHSFVAACCSCVFRWIKKLFLC